MIGHITKLELQKELIRTDAGCGFGNRHLWCAVKRSKLLPEGGVLPDSDFKQISEKLDKVTCQCGPLMCPRRRRLDSRQTGGDVKVKLKWVNEETSPQGDAL